MSYDYSNGLEYIPELKESQITVDTPYYNEFPDYKTLSNYKYLVIREWNEPLPELPPSIIAISFMNDCNYPLNNLHPTVEAIEFYYDINVPLDNLPQNLLYLGILGLSNRCYKFPLNYLPQSLQILYITSYLEDDCYSNLPTALKSLTLSSVNQSIGHYPTGLEHLNLRSIIPYTSMSNNIINNLHLELLPVSLKKLYLPVLLDYSISDSDKIYPDLDLIIARLINLEELDLSGWSNIIRKDIFSTNLHLICIGNNYGMLEQIPNSIKTLSISDYKENLQSKDHNLQINFESIVNSNITHIELDISDYVSDSHDLCIDILAYIPNNLQELTVLETHPALSQFAIKYPNVKIKKLPNYYYQEKFIDDMRGGYLYW